MTWRQTVLSFTVTNSANEILLALTLSLATGERVTVQSKIYPKNLPFGATFIQRQKL